MEAAGIFLDERRDDFLMFLKRLLYHGADIFGVHKAMIFEIMQHQFVNIVELERNWSMVYLLCI